MSPFAIGSRLPMIRQSEAAECGLACLAMIASYHGLKSSLHSLRLEHAVSARGMSLNDLMMTANRLDLTPRALSVPLESIDQLELPCILHWELNHFVVLAKVGRSRFVIHDPARGARCSTRSEVSQKFSGIALELRPAVTFRPRDQRRRMRLRDFWTRVNGMRSVLLQTLLLSAAIQALVLAAPFYMQLVVDEVLTRFDIDLLAVLALGFGLLVILRELSVAARGWQILYLGASLDYGMGTNLARQLFRLPMAWFEKRHAGDIISRFSSTHAVRRLFAEGLVAALIDGVMALTTLVVLFVYSPKLASVVLAALVAAIVTRLTFYRSLEDRTRDEIVAKAGEQSALIESIRGMQSIKVFGKEAQRQSCWQNRLAESVNASVRLGRITLGLGTASAALFGIEHVVVIYLGALAVIEGGFTVGMLFAFVAYRRHLLESATALIERLIEFSLLGVHLDRVADIALSPPEASAPEGDPLSFDRAQRGVPLVTLRIRRFAFGPGEATLLSNLSLDVYRGEFLVIVGPSGCGKSTLLKLLLGLLEAEEGEIRYRGVPLARLPKTEYRRRFGTVMQDDMLLSGSLAENIAFFDPSPDLDRVRECAELASIHDDIAAMPMGYNSLVGDMGSVLSAGQRQRVLLARALYARPEILILDEGTAHLDPVSEQAVMESIAKLDCTRICVSHGIRAIRSSDRTLMLHERTLRRLDKKCIPVRSPTV